MDDKIIPHLVARFFSWKLPPDFRPDAGISFVAEYNNCTPEGGRHEPCGTNLLNAEQAFSMFRHVLDHPAVTALPSRELLAEALEALDFYANKDNHKMRREPSYRDRFSQNMKPGRPKLGRVSEDKGKRARAAADKIRAALKGEA